MVRYGTNHHKSPLCGSYYTVYTADLQVFFTNFLRKKVPISPVFSCIFGTFEHLFDNRFLSLFKMLFSPLPPPQDAVVFGVRPPDQGHEKSPACRLASGAGFFVGSWGSAPPLPPNTALLRRAGSPAYSEGRINSDWS